MQDSFATSPPHSAIRNGQPEPDASFNVVSLLPQEGILKELLADAPLEGSEIEKSCGYGREVKP